MAKIKVKNSVTVAETFHDFPTGKKAAGVSEKNLRATFSSSHSPRITRSRARRAM